MRKAKPPVGWERAKNCFPVPNELLCFDLPAGAVAVYIYLLRHADRRTNQCYPSEATMARDLHLARNTACKYVRLLEEKELIRTERTSIVLKNGRKRNGSLLYTLLPWRQAVEQFHQRQLAMAEAAAERQQVQQQLAEQAEEPPCSPL